MVERLTPAYRSNDSTEAADERDVSLSSALRIRGGGPVWNRLKAENPDRITGYTCPCDGDGYRTAQGLELPPTVPAIVLDPFGGTGTVAMVARALGRHGVHVDLSADYNRLARWRITDLDQLAAVQGHQRTKRQPDDQPTLLDEIPEVSA